MAGDDVHHMSHNETMARDCRGPGRSFRLRNVGVVSHDLHSRFYAEILQGAIDPLNDPLNDQQNRQSLVRHGTSCALLCDAVSIVETHYIRKIFSPLIKTGTSTLAFYTLGW